MDQWTNGPGNWLCKWPGPVWTGYHSPAPPAPPRPCPWHREAFKLRLLTFLTACCGASRCAVDVAVAEKANKPNVLRIIIFAVRRTRINISTVASPSHCAHCTLKAVSAGRSMRGGVAGGSYSGAWFIIKCMWFILECASLTLASQSKRQNQADKLLHWEKLLIIKSHNSKCLFHLVLAFILACLLN